jgi:hypothetical protein
MRSTSKFVTIIIAILFSGLLAGFILRNSVHAQQAGSESAPVAVAEPTTTVPAPVAVTEESAQVTPSQPARPSSGGQSSGTATGGGHASTPAPVITKFQTPENIDCHNGNFQNFSASWTTVNAVKTTISIDGAGVYQTYGPNADTSLPFNCSSAHTFRLTAFGSDGKTVSRSTTLQPRNVQPPSNGDDDV